MWYMYEYMLNCIFTASSDHDVYSYRHTLSRHYVLPFWFLRAAVRKSLGVRGRGARGARDQQRAERVLVEPVDGFGPHRRFIFQRIEQAIDLLLGLRASLRR